MRKVLLAILLITFSVITLRHLPKAIAALQNASQNSKLTTGLVGLWSFNGADVSGATAYDRSGQGNNGTLTNGPVRTIGKLGQGLEFDGVNDYVTFSAPSIGGAGTIALWARKNMDESLDAFLYDTSGTRSLLLLDRPGNNYLWWVNGTSVGTFSNLFQSGVSGEWTHVVFVWDNAPPSDKEKIYKNGALFATANVTVGTGNATNWYLGSRFDQVANEFWKGSIDDVRIYNRALSASEVYRLYNMGASKVNASQNSKLTTGLVGLWSFNGADVSGATAYDRSGQGNNGTLTNGPKPVIGKLGQALQFDGSDDHVALATDTQFGGESITISAWVNIRALTTDVMDIVSKHATGGAAKYFHTFINTSGKAGWYTFATCGSVAAELLGNTVLPLNTWQHVIWVLKHNTSHSIYLNGVLDGSGGAVSIPSGCGATQTRIGWNQREILKSFNGLIDDVRIYNRALSIDEIKRLYNLGR